MLLVLTLLTVLSSGCGRSEAKYTADGKKQIITIGYLPITHALAVFEEKELLDADENSTLQIQLQKFSSWTDLMDALNSGRINGASVLAELAMAAVSNGLDLKAVALGHKDGNVVIVSNDITKVEDLKGKTFAIPSNQSSHNILLNDMLSDAGMLSSLHRQKCRLPWQAVQLMDIALQNRSEHRLWCRITAMCFMIPHSCGRIPSAVPSL